VRLGSRALAIALLVTLGAASCSGGDDRAAPAPLGDADGAAPGAAREEPPAVLRVGLAGVTTLDPALLNGASPSQSIVADVLFDGLTRFDASTYTVVGDLATTWGVSADGLTWTFTLDPDARFSDGSPITATDVKATLERIAALGVKSVAGLRLSAVDGYDEFLTTPSAPLRGIEAPDAATVVVRLRTPFPSFDALLTDPTFGIVPATTSRDQSSFAGVPVTSGPFRVTRRTAEVVETTRADGSAAAVDAITLRLYPDANAAHAAFRDGVVDVSVLASEDLAAAADDGSLVLSSPQQVSMFYGMNVASPALASPALRRAIVLAVDRDGIRASVFGDTADTMNGLLGPGVTGTRANACGSACAHDPEQARSIIAVAYPDGGVPTIHVDYYEDESGREAAVAQAIVEDLVAVGIPAEARASTFDAYGQLLTSGNAELFRFGWIGAYPAADAYLDPLFGTGGSDNVFSLSDAELDGLLASARAAVDATQRSSIAMSAEDRALALDVVVPLVRYRSHLVASPAVHDVVIAPNGSFDAERSTLRP
jgi:ABC-type transport system substrate-binding protein